MPKVKTRGAISKSDILEAAFTMFEAEGDEGFSVRKVAALVGVDPMTVLHHFGTKRELLRAIADRAVHTVVIPPSTDDWRHDLRSIGAAYRELALRNPRVFRLHFHFHATGPADHRAAEIVYRAMLRAGRPNREAAGLGLAFYAFVLGFALAEAEGLLLPITADDEAELLGLCPEMFPATRALVPAFKQLNPNDTFESAMEICLEGLASSWRRDDASEGSDASHARPLSPISGVDGRLALRKPLI
ncbi:MAG: TetR/AcrR family transcriptional regulator [Hyphomicrobium sp.]